MRNIVLTGFMASGKTEIGKQLACLTGMAFVDTDAMVEEAAGCTVNAIFENQGEPVFRQLETEAVRRAAALSGAVISTGGGVVLRRENIEILRKTGVIVNLELPEGVLLARMRDAGGTRPLLREDTQAIFRRLQERKPFYDCCDVQIRVSNEKKPLEHAEEILKRLDFFPKIE